jgi:translation initiation factor 3 subunit B
VFFRPATLLSKDQAKDIKKNLKKYSVKFNQKDAQRSNKASAELAAARQRLMAQFCKWKEGKEEEYARTRSVRIELRGGVDTDNDEGDQFTEELVEFLMKEDTTIIQE